MKAKKIDRLIKYWSHPFYDFILDFSGNHPYDLYIQLLEDEGKKKKRR